MNRTQFAVLFVLARGQASRTKPIHFGASVAAPLRIRASLQVSLNLVRNSAKSAAKQSTQLASGRVAVGDYSPTAPTDPDVRALAHPSPFGIGGAI